MCGSAKGPAAAKPITYPMGSLGWSQMDISGPIVANEATLVDV